jgi:hypothetical protein
MPNQEDTNTAASVKLNPLFEADKLTALKKVMDDREIFDSLEAAMGKLDKIAATLADPKDPDADPIFGLPVEIRGADPTTGEIDNDLYAGNRAVLAYVGTRGKNTKGEAVVGIKGIVLFPVPTLDTFLASEEGRGLVGKVLDKELAHVAFRQVREANTSYEFSTGVTAMPVSVTDFATASSRGVDTSTFDILWPGLRDAIKERKPELHKLLPNKAVFLNALRSKQFAETEDETKALESTGWIVKLGQMLIKAAPSNVDTDTKKPAPLDASIIQNWLDTRDEFTFESRAAKPKDFSILGSIDMDF